MTEASASYRSYGLTLRQAALTAGFGILIMAFFAPAAEFYVFPKLFVDGDIEATRQNILQNPALFWYGAMGHFITLTCDIFVAWALYVLFRPVNPALSLLAALFRLVYTVIAFVGLFNLFTAFRMMASPDHAAAIGAEQLNAQVYVLLNSFGYIWSAGLILFGAHLFLLGMLILKSSYVPSIIGALVSIAGLGYFAYYLSAYVAPDFELGWLFFTFFGELIFMLWLLIAGWTLKGPAS